MNERRVEQTIFWIVPGSVLLGAFIGICVMTGTAWPWNQVVHEDGVRTLLRTIFFFEHAARELIPDAILALGLAGAVRYYLPPSSGALSHDASRRRRRLALIWLITVIVIVAGTLFTAGAQSLIENLSQFHTREGAPLVWGAHWRYHLIGRLAQMFLALSVSGVVRLLRAPAQRPPMGRIGLFGGSIAAFVILTLVFRPTSEPFTDPAFLGHQLREMFTHLLVTVPLTLAVCFGLARRYSTQAASGALPPEPPLWPIVVTGAFAVFSGVFLLVASLLTGAQSHGQATGLAALLLAHFFEHTLGYIFVPAFGGWAYLSSFPTRSDSPAVS